MKMNSAENRWRLKLSETFDFTAEDKVDDATFNEVIWIFVQRKNSLPPFSESSFPFNPGTG